MECMECIEMNAKDRSVLNTPSCGVNESFFTRDLYSLKPSLDRIDSRVFLGPLGPDVLTTTCLALWHFKSRGCWIPPFLGVRDGHLDLHYLSVWVGQELGSTSKDVRSTSEECRKDDDFVRSVGFDQELTEHQFLLKALAEAPFRPSLSPHELFHFCVFRLDSGKTEVHLTFRPCVWSLA